jgi:two-component sensor histidine kinase
VASLLSLRLRQTSDPAARGALADAAAQVAAIADVHEVIQSSTDLDQVDLCELIGSVCRGLGKGSPCEVVFQGTRKIAVDPRQATQVAVIVNELVTNALKHATSGVEVSCRYDGDTVLISVRDDGAGLPAGFDPIRQGRFGLPMASSLARRLGGSLTGHSTTPGTTWQVRLPLAKLATPAPDRGRFAQRRA